MVLSRVGVWRIHADLAGCFAPTLALNVVKPRLRFDHAPAAKLADQNAAEFALPDQFGLRAPSDTEQLLEGLA
jgi:hypothetical protein